jgi:protein-S-isoprenylcysteine O-methyltransferase Ste14
VADRLTASAAERAERFSRKRTCILWIEFVLFVIWQGGFMFLLRPQPTSLRTVDRVEQSAWIVWALVLLGLIGTGGALFRSADIRRLMNDEVSTANRHEAQRWGFWAAITTVTVLYGVTLFEPISLNVAAHAILTLGIGAALWRFAWLERRADRAA